jgi:hypothetical protein
MFTRILTALERKKIKSYLKQDGEKDAHIRVLATYGRRNLPVIKSDLELLDKFLTTYATKK